MSILVDIVFTCDGCHEVTVIEHDGVAVGERPPAISLPNLWNGVDTGRTLCPKCCEEPVPMPQKPLVSEG